jgi:TDG/mug DNA glycosylase family protein
MAESVPLFLAKVARYRPRFVCFVGMGIWRIVEKVISKTAESGVGSSTHSKAKLKKSNVGLQPYKLAYDENLGKQSFEAHLCNVFYSPVDKQRSVRETFIFVVPSTSGRVVSHQVS